MGLSDRLATSPATEDEDVDVLDLLAEEDVAATRPKRSNGAKAPAKGKAKAGGSAKKAATSRAGSRKPTKKRTAAGTTAKAGTKAKAGAGSGGRPTVEPADGEGHEGVRARRLREVRLRTHEELVRTLGPKLYEGSMDGDELEVLVKETLTEILERDETALPAADRRHLVSQTIDDILGHGPIEPLLADPTIDEVMCNGNDGVYVERGGRIEKTDVRFNDEAHLRRTIERIVARVGRRIDESSPYVDARLGDGSRVNAVIPPIAVDGPMLTIRKFAAEGFTGEDLVRFGTWNEQALEFLRACVRGRVNILVTGGTGAGKTTTLNVLSNAIGDGERILTVEDAVELRLDQPHVIRLEHRPPNIEGRGEVTIRDLVRNALRMRPDRIVVGECRGGEALDMLQAMNTGHDGSISTVHCNSPRDALSRLETMVLMAGMDLPARAIREQIASAVGLIVHQARMRDGSRRVTHITEVTGMEGEVITAQDLFLFEQEGFDDDGRILGGLVPTGVRPKLVSRLEAEGVPVKTSWFLPPDHGRRRR